MTRVFGRSVSEEVNALTAACLLGALAGGLSVVVPYFQSLTVALAALATLAFVMRRRPRVDSSSLAEAMRRSRGWAGPALLTGGWAIFFLAPLPTEGARAALLGAALVGVWLSVGRAPRPLPEARP